MVRNFVAIILARGDSKGIKLKNLFKINKKPMIFWTIKHCLDSRKIDSVWVSSDNKKILNYSKTIGAKIIKRPKNLSTDNSSSESAWEHAINHLNNCKIYMKNVVGLQPTSPIRNKNDIDKAISLFVRKKYDSLFTASKIKDFFTWTKKNNKILPEYPELKKRKRRQDMKDLYLENGSFYIFNKDEFLKTKERLFGKIGVYEMSKIHSFEIDDMIDTKIVNSLKKFF